MSDESEFQPQSITQANIPNPQPVAPEPTAPSAIPFNPIEYSREVCKIYIPKSDENNLSR